MNDFVFKKKQYENVGDIFFSTHGEILISLCICIWYIFTCTYVYTRVFIYIKIVVNKPLKISSSNWMYFLDKKRGTEFREKLVNYTSSSNKSYDDSGVYNDIL